MNHLLQEYSKKWFVNSLHLIAETPTSHVYRGQRDQQNVVLKIYTETGRVFENIGPEFLNLCQGNGVVHVMAYDGNACLLDYIDGPELITLVHDGKDDKATEIIAHTLQKIHATPVPQKHPFIDLAERFDALFKHSKIKETPDIIKRIAPLASNKLKQQKEICVLHGDIHHKNILHDTHKGWLAIDPQPLIADRAYDCANTLNNPHQTPELTENPERLKRQAEIIGNILDISVDRIIDYACIHACLSACWSKDDDGDYCQLSLNTAKILEQMIKGR